MQNYGQLNIKDNKNIINNINLNQSLFSNEFTFNEYNNKNNEVNNNLIPFSLNRNMIR